MLQLDSKLITLLEWINNTQDEKLVPSSHSYISSKIEVRDVAGSGRGIYTKQTINKSELILRIPNSFLLNSTTVLSHISKYNPDVLSNPSIYVPSPIHDEYTKIYQEIDSKKLVELTSFQLLGMYISIERKRGDSSFWKPFIDMLPSISDFQLMPLVWQVTSQQELLDLLPKSTKQIADKVYTRFITDYNIVNSLVSITLDEFLISWICINSRCLYMNLPNSKSNQDNFTMAPYVDFLNHSPLDHCTLKIDGKGFQVLTTSSYKPDQEIYLSYGPHSNDFLLCEYGFTISENKWNDLDITSYLTPLFTKQQLEFLVKHDYSGNYTVNSTGISFRTEVAMAVLQESHPMESRKLLGLINGVIDGSVFKSVTDKYVKDCMKRIIDEADKFKYLEFSDEKRKVIGGLYSDRVGIARGVLASLTEA
ncbi:Ribosomal lysine N-methyltransferase 2 [Spathaspora sp. JA1]|nr:Ribosomal lysine N-methyltransferase 2 [Spathaspora sp. JA1]